MKSIIILSLILSSSAFADFSDQHASLCAGKKNCQLVLAPVKSGQISMTCEGKLADISCKVMMLKTTDSSSMNLICGETDTPLLTQVLEADVLSYNVSAISGTTITNDPSDYHLFSSPALDVHLTQGEKKNAKIVLSLQDRSISLTNVTCE